MSTNLKSSIMKFFLTFFLLYTACEVTKAQHTFTNTTTNGTNNVGIGTTNPTSILQVETSGSYFSNSWKVNNGSADQTPGITIINNNSSGRAAWLGAGTGGSAFMFDNGGSFYIITDSKYNFQNNLLGNGTPLMVVNPNGNVGMGTITPGGNLSVVGSSTSVEAHILNTSSTGYQSLHLGTDGSSADGAALIHCNSSWTTSGANVADGTTLYGFGAGGLNLTAFNSGGSMNFYTGGNTSSNLRAVITSDGKMGIGTTNPGTFRLAVEGNIGARKIVVTHTTPWPDYVFKKAYKLPTLDEIEKFVQINQHLPEIPSAEDVKKNGIDLGENQALLLKKIEELTLIVIEQNKKLIEQDKRITELQINIKPLKNLLVKYPN